MGGDCSMRRMDNVSRSRNASRRPIDHEYFEATIANEELMIPATLHRPHLDLIEFPSNDLKRHTFGLPSGSRSQRSDTANLLVFNRRFTDRGFPWPAQLLRRER